MVDIKKLEDDLSKFIYELETEDRLVRVGLKDTAETSKIYKKYKNLFTRENISEIKKTIDGIQKASSHKITKKPNQELDILERIYFTLAGSYIGLATAPEEDTVTTYFSKARVRVNGEEIAYFEINPRISKEPIYMKRELYDDAAGGVVSKINSKQLAILKQEISLIRGLGFKGYIDYFSQEKKMDMKAFYQLVLKIKKDTDTLWKTVMSEASQEIFSRPFKNIRSCHLAYLRSMTMYDRFYPKERVVESFIKFTNDFGFGDLLKYIKIDDKDRAKKNPRAVCYWPTPPTEIHLVIKPIGGEQDFEALFHEGGHALHGASIDKNLPYSLKALAHSNALTEAYAFLLEDLVFEPAWVISALNVSDFTALKIKRQAYFVNLMMLRRYLGKYIYEYELFAKGKLQQGPSLYKKSLDSATGFVHKKENYLNDMDTGFYSSNYLRAWIAAAQIKDYLVKKFGKKWFTNKRAGKFLRDLWARGVTDEVEDVVRRLGYKPWDTALLVRGYREILGK